ncbi:MAG: hypothetical protein NT029_11510 [Armatimonadetes bacterium]|nr:hypothetical protein [Armatimonadota bacterium]
MRKSDLPNYSPTRFVCIRLQSHRGIAPGGFSVCSLLLDLITRLRRCGALTDIYHEHGMAEMAASAQRRAVDADEAARIVCSEALA